MRLSSFVAILSFTCIVSFMIGCSKTVEEFYDTKKKHVMTRTQYRMKNGTQQRHGKSESFYDDGKLRGVVYYQNDLKTGIEQCYFRNGQLSLQSRWENGKTDTIETFFESGNKEWIDVYDHNFNKIEGISWYENGQLFSHWKLSDEENRKEVFTYFENGGIKSHLKYDTAGFDRHFAVYYEVNKRQQSTWYKVLENSDTLVLDTLWNSDGLLENVRHTTGNIITFSAEYDDFFGENPYLKEMIVFSPSDSSYTHSEYNSNKMIARRYKTTASRNPEKNRDTLPGTVFISYYPNGKKESEYVLKTDTNFSTDYTGKIDSSSRTYKNTLERVNQWDESGKLTIKDGVDLEELRKKTAFENKHRKYLGVWVLISESRTGKKNGKACNEVKRFTINTSKELANIFISDIWENLRINYCYNDYEYRCNDFEISISGTKMINNNNTEDASNITVSSKILTITNENEFFKEYGSEDTYTNIRIEKKYQYVGSKIPESFTKATMGVTE